MKYKYKQDSNSTQMSWVLYTETTFQLFCRNMFLPGSFVEKAVERWQDWLDIDVIALLKTFQGKLPQKRQ